MSSPHQHTTEFLDNSQSPGQMHKSIRPSPLQASGPTTNALKNQQAPKPDLSSLISVHDFEDVAKQRFSKKAYAFYSSAADDLVSQRANVQCLRQILLRPRILRNVKRASIKRSILGCESEAPFFVCPAAMAGLAHPEGEKAIARACAKQGIVQGVCDHLSL